MCKILTETQHEGVNSASALRGKYNQRSTMVRNEAIVSIDSLEKSIIETAPFCADFSEIFSNFRKCQDAPFLS